MKISNKWKKQAELYKRFAEDWKDCLFFTEEDELSMYLHESQGTEINSQANGYFVGKKWLNLNVTMWKEDLGKTLFLSELYEDFPAWWLRKQLKKSNDGDGERVQ